MLEGASLWAGRRERSAVGRLDIHDAIAQSKKLLGRERFGKEVREIVRRGDKGNDYLVVLDALTDEEMTSIYMLCPRMQLGIVAQRDGRLVVHAQFDGRHLRVTELVEEAGQVDS